MNLPVFQGITRWSKTGRWSGTMGPTYAVQAGPHFRYVIFSSRWRCGEPGRRGYLTTYQTLVYPAGQTGITLGEKHELARAIMLANEHFHKEVKK